MDFLTLRSSAPFANGDRPTLGTFCSKLVTGASPTECELGGALSTTSGRVCTQHAGPRRTKPVARARSKFNRGERSVRRTDDRPGREKPAIYRAQADAPPRGRQARSPTTPPNRGRPPPGRGASVGAADPLATTA